MQVTYPHWAKYPAQTSYEKPHRKCHPVACTKAKDSVKDNPKITKKYGVRQYPQIPSLLEYIDKLTNTRVMKLTLKLRQILLQVFDHSDQLTFPKEQMSELFQP